MDEKMKIQNLSIEAGEYTIEITDNETYRHALMSRTVLESYVRLSSKQKAIIDNVIIGLSIEYDVIAP